jgi:hypothetical protein
MQKKGEQQELLDSRKEEKETKIKQRKDQRSRNRKKLTLTETFPA